MVHKSKKGLSQKSLESDRDTPSIFNIYDCALIIS